MVCVISIPLLVCKVTVFLARGIYDRNYNVIDVKENANKLSHVLYAFANLDAEGNIVLGVSSEYVLQKMPINV